MSEIRQRLEGYQKLEQDFFRLCMLRNIRGEARTLLIYLRGLYCYFGRPRFYCSDSQIREDLGLSAATMLRARKLLQERGVIEYRSHHGRGKACEYLILKTDLAPETKPIKKMCLNAKKMGFNEHRMSTKTHQKDVSQVSRQIKNKEEYIPVNRNTMKNDIDKLLATLNSKEK